MLKKLKNNKKKGFTLVELIVVLVILAILAALLIPALTGYINKAKDKSITAETRQVVMAAQTLVDEAYAKDSTDAITIKSSGGTISYADVYKLAEVDGTLTSEPKVSTEGKVTEVVYKNSGKTCKYSVADDKTKGTYEVDPKANPGN